MQPVYHSGIFLREVLIRPLLQIGDGSFEVLIRCWPLHECTGAKKGGGDATCLAPGPYQVALNSLASVARCMAAHVHLEFI